MQADKESGSKVSTSKQSSRVNSQIKTRSKLCEQVQSQRLTQYQLTEDKAIYIRLALIVASLLVLGNGTWETKVKEPAHFDNVAIAVPKELEQSELPQMQEKSQIVLASQQRTTANNAAVLPPTGSHEQWMQQAGIQPSDYHYVEFIISHESGWRPGAVNASSGACGLVQALPCSKLGSDWSNPVVALKWGNSYVKSRYGGWAQAHAFWSVNRWY